MCIMIAIMQSDDAMRAPVHFVISNATLASDENGYSLHKNVGEYRDEERSRTGTCISVRKGLETEWNEVIPRGGSKVVPSNAKSWFIWGLVVDVAVGTVRIHCVTSKVRNSRMLGVITRISMQSS